MSQTLHPSPDIHIRPYLHRHKPHANDGATHISHHAAKLMSAANFVTSKRLVEVLEADDPSLIHHEPPPLKTALEDYLSLEAFRAAHGLPETFGLSTFQPKNQAGLGSMVCAGEALRQLREAVLVAIPRSVPVMGLYTLALQLQLTFRSALLQANAQVGLKASEVAFAVNGFGEVCQTEAHTLLQAHLQRVPPPAFEQIYQTWLANTLMMTHKPYHYRHGKEIWRVYVMAHAFGRFGLAVCRVSKTRMQTHYVRDTSLVCPAQNFMEALLRDVSARLRLMWTTAPSI